MVSESTRIFINMFLAAFALFIIIATVFPIFPITEVVIFYSNNVWNATYSFQKLTLAQYAFLSQTFNSQIISGSSEANVKLIGLSNSNNRIDSFNSIIFDRNFTIIKGINILAIDKIVTSNEELIVNISSSNFSKVMFING